MAKWKQHWKMKGRGHSSSLLNLPASALPLSATSPSTLPQSYQDPISASEARLEHPFPAQSIRTLTWMATCIGRVRTGPARRKADESPKWHWEKPWFPFCPFSVSSPFWHFHLAGMAARKARHKYTPLPQPADLLEVKRIFIIGLNG